MERPEGEPNPNQVKKKLEDRREEKGNEIQIPPKA